MGSVWLLDLPDVLAEAGVPVREWPGWETRSRSSGGLNALMAIGMHHDGSPPHWSEDQSCAYHATGSPIAPVGSVNLGRNGRWTVIAAGATNTQGQGGPVSTSQGHISKGNGNLWFLSIEANNNGIGEPWPDEQLESYLAGVGALVDAYDLTYADVFAHFEWTNPGKDPAAGDWGFRKIDPAGPCVYAIPDAARPDMWDMDAFRADLAASDIEPEPEPEPEPEDEDMATVTRISQAPAPLDPYVYPWLFIWDNGNVSPVGDDPLPPGVPSAPESSVERYLNLARAAGCVVPLEAT